MNSIRIVKNNFLLSLLACVSISAFVYYCFITSNYLYLLAFPILFITIIGFIKPDFIWYSIAFFTPLSINPSDVDYGKLSLALPTEPFLVLLMFLFLYHITTTKNFDKEFFTHPFSLLIYAYLGWMFLTSLTSVDKIVSLKYWISKVWFIIPMYYLGYSYFKERRTITQFVSMFLWAMLIVCIYNTVHLSTYGFEDKPSQWTMQPFFKSHAVLGAINAMCIPLALGMIQYNRGKGLAQVVYFFITLSLIICLIITYSRAAWISVIPSVLLFIAFKIRISFKFIMSFIFLALLVSLFNIDTILSSLEANKVASSDDLVENFESISNISSDASNLERINRWACAIDMWKKKPLLGFGPGTYMTEYAPFQLSSNYTEISTNSGDVGNSHSEYLGPLAEQGLLGGLLFFTVMLFSVFYSFKTYYRATDRMDKIIISMSACALISYFTHGFLNNFLEMDKAAILFWGLICVLVSYDLKQSKTTESIVD